MREPKCLKLAKKIVRLLERNKAMPCADLLRAMVIARELWDSGVDEEVNADWDKRRAEMNKLYEDYPELKYSSKTAGAAQPE